MANGHLDELQKAEIASTSKLVPSVFITSVYITEQITSNKFNFRGGRYRQVLLYVFLGVKCRSMPSVAAVYLNLHGPRHIQDKNSAVPAPADVLIPSPT